MTTPMQALKEFYQDRPYSEPNDGWILEHMTIPTQAQIEAALAAYSEAYKYPFDMRTALSAAITAAAQVGQVDFLCPQCGARGYIKDGATTTTATAHVGKQLANRPVMWRVMDDNIWRVFSDEKEAQDYADKIGIGNYQGLYVRDGAAAAQVGEQDWCEQGKGKIVSADTVRADTIERCAQHIQVDYPAAASRIRKLKDEP